MISFFKKANRGLCLTIVVLFILAGYVINVELSRTQQKPAVLSACEAYLEAYDELVVLPEKYKMNSPGVNLSAHVSSLKNTIDPYLSPTNYNLQFELDTLKANFENQQKYGPLIVQASKKISGNPEFSFSGNEVTVMLPTMTSVSYMYPGDTAPTESKVSYTDTIVLEKVNDEWKIVYSILYYAIY